MTKLSELLTNNDKATMLRRMQNGVTHFLIIRPHGVTELHRVEQNRITDIDYITVRKAVELYTQHEWEIVDGTIDTVREAL